MMFRIGDKVKIIDIESNHYGQIGEIKKIYREKCLFQILFTLGELGCLTDFRYQDIEELEEDKLMDIKVNRKVMDKEECFRKMFLKYHSTVGSYTQKDFFNEVDKMYTYKGMQEIESIKIVLPNQQVNTFIDSPGETEITLTYDQYKQIEAAIKGA